MKNRKYGFGLIGCGMIHSVHADAIQGLKEARLVAVCDLLEERARATGEKYGCDYYSDYHQLLAREDVELVNILTPSGTHAKIGIEAARAGKHVIVTKPIDVTLEAIDSLIGECEKNDVKLGATHQFRSYDSYQRLKQAMEEGRLGKLLMGITNLKWHRPQSYYDSADWRGTKELDGGAMMNQGVHYIDLLQWICGEVDSVCAHTATLNHDIEVEDTCTTSLRFRNGCLGMIVAATSTYKGLPTTLEIHGERGNVAVVGDRIASWDVGEEESISEASAEQTAVSEPAKGLSAAVPAHQVQIADVLKAIEEDRSPQIDGREARKAVEIILAAYQSSETGTIVKLPL